MEQKKIGQIREEYEALSFEELKEWCGKYQEDSRSGVQALLKKAQRRMESYQEELCRIEQMKVYERQYAEYEYICGVDEAGRGPLVGPVVAGAVILPKDCTLLYIDDSKKLSEKKREELYEKIMEQAVAVGVGVADHQVIDDINILQATYQAMRDAIANLSVQPSLLLNDAVTIPEIAIPQVPIVHGDAKSISIGAASIIAKVTRDRLMQEYDKQYPEYQFAKHKGYGTKLHMEMLQKYGPCPIHRRTFIKKYVDI